MIKGTYIFYQDGKEICRSPNIITRFGKRFIANYIAGNIEYAGKDMCFGVDSTAATELDTRLGFEFYRVPVSLGSTEIQTATITTVSGSGSVLTYTASNTFSAGQTIKISGMTPSGYNSSAAVVTSATSSSFTVAGTTTAAYVSGGTAFLYSVVYKATIPQDVAGQIKEIGIYPSTRSSINNYEDKFLSSFSDSLDWSTSSLSNPSYSVTGAQVGENVLLFTSLGSAAQQYFNYNPIDLSGYSVNDSIRLAYNKLDANLQNIILRFYSSDSDYYSITITPEGGTGYKITSSILLSTVFSGIVGTPDKSNIIKTAITVTPTSGNTTSVGMDGLRINDEDTFDPVFGLISRSVLSSPLIKASGRSVDVEYRLDLGFA